MKMFRFYHRATGVIHPTKFQTTDERSAERNRPDDEHLVIEGDANHLCQRVAVEQLTPTLVPYQPPQPSLDHEWTENGWQLSAAAIKQREKRRWALIQIASLEASQGRAIREHVLGNADGTKRLQAIEAQIAALRGDL